MNLIDVHSHLNHEYFKDKLDETINNAKKAGLKRIVVSGTNKQANRDVMELVEMHPRILRASLGIHPIDALGLFEDNTGLPDQKSKIDLDEELKFIEEHQDKIVSIGEIGLDFHWDKEHHEEQKEIFKEIIRFAVKIKKPIVIHTWEAEEECIDILESEIKREETGDGKIPENEIPVVLHCFGGRKALITKARELGYYFTVPPSILRIGNFQTLVKKVPLTQLFTETDAPWQSPFKDKRNEPAFVVETIKKIAHIKKISEEEVAEQIWKNYETVFGE